MLEKKLTNEEHHALTALLYHITRLLIDKHPNDSELGKKVRYLFKGDSTIDEFMKQEDLEGKVFGD